MLNRTAQYPALPFCEGSVETRGGRSPAEGEASLRQGARRTGGPRLGALNFFRDGGRRKMRRPLPRVGQRERESLRPRKERRMGWRPQSLSDGTVENPGECL